MKHFWIPLLPLLLWGCGASEPTKATSSPESANKTENIEEGIAFNDMAFGERKSFMKDVILPQMKPHFVEKRPDFSCASCHGDNLSDVNFEMPNTLSPLNPKAMPFESENEKTRAAAKWMKETIVPNMARLLKEKPYNPETKTGFGCFECHATELN